LNQIVSVGVKPITLSRSAVCSRPSQSETDD
jgi:hypothetical protein